MLSPQQDANHHQAYYMFKGIPSYTFTPNWHPGIRATRFSIAPETSDSQKEGIIFQASFLRAVLVSGRIYVRIYTYIKCPPTVVVLMSFWKDSLLTYRSIGQHDPLGGKIDATGRQHTTRISTVKLLFEGFCHFTRGRVEVGGSACETRNPKIPRK